MSDRYPTRPTVDPLMNDPQYRDDDQTPRGRGVDEEERETGWAASLVDQTQVESAKCPICMLLLRDPHLTGCCGAHYCKVCIDQWLAEKDYCPICRSTDIAIFPNMAKQREIMDLRVCCSNKASGCKWEGELRDLQEHLHGSCSYARYPCKWGCGTVLMGIQLEQHQIDCPNLPRENLVPVLRDQHRKLQIEVRNLRSRNDRLQADNLKLKSQITEMQESQDNILLQLSEGRGRNDDLKRQLNLLVKEVKDLSMRVDRGGGGGGHDELQKLKDYSDHQNRILDQTQTRLEATIKLAGLAPPRLLIMQEYSKYKLNNRWWQSEPFFSHPCGYKMRMEIRAAGNGGGAGTHVSLYVHVMSGKFDDLLVWPLAADVHFKLINHYPGGKHFESKVSFTQNNEASYKVAEGKLTGTGRGYAQFLPHSSVNIDQLKGTHYLKNDCLHFEIFKVIVFCLPGSDVA